MPKKISLKKHIMPGVAIQTSYRQFYTVISVGEKEFLAEDSTGFLEPFYYDTPMTVYGRIADNNLPF